MVGSLGSKHILRSETCSNVLFNQNYYALKSHGTKLEHHFSVERKFSANKNDPVKMQN